MFPTIFELRRTVPEPRADNVLPAKPFAIIGFSNVRYSSNTSISGDIDRIERTAIHHPGLIDGHENVSSRKTHSI